MEAVTPPTTAKRSKAKPVPPVSTTGETTTEQAAAAAAVAARLGALGAVAAVEPEVSSPAPEAPKAQPERWYDPAPVAAPAMSSLRPEVSSLEPEVSSLEPEVSSLEPEISSLEPEPPAYGSSLAIVPVNASVAEAPDALAASAASDVVPASTGAAVGASAVTPGSLTDQTAAGAESTKLDRRLERMRSDPSAGVSGVSDATAIGAATALFDCPNCQRPLPVGTSRCPQCNTRLIGGRTARRVGTIVGAALVAVVAIAVGMTAVLAMSGGSSNGTATVPTGAPSASGAHATATPTIGATHEPGTSGIPGGAGVALSGSTLINTRITQDGAALARTLADKRSQTIDVARAIRVVAADAQQGLDMSGRLEPWAEAAQVKAQLDAFYQGLASTALDALRASLTDDATYRQAGARLVTQIRKVDEVDAASRALASSVGLQLPALGDPGTVISPPPAP